MKKITTLLCLLILAGYTANAQPGLNKLKKKAEEMKEKKKDAVAPSAQTNNSTPGSEANIDASPAAVSIRKFRADLYWGQEAVKKQHLDADTRVEDLGKLLAKIKADDPNWSEYSKDEADYLELKKAYDQNNADEIIEKRLERFQLGMHYAETEPAAKTLEYADILNKKSFEELKAFYAGKPNLSTAYSKKVLDKGELFYPNTLPGVVKATHNLVDETIEKTVSYLKESREKSNYLESHRMGLFDPKGHLEKIEKAIGICDKAIILVPEDAGFVNKKSLLNNRKTDIETYISSGGFDKDVATIKQMDFDAILLSKPGTTNPQLEAVVKRDVSTADYGPVVRVVIVSTSWNINRNELGIIIDKSMSVQTVNKKDGVCYRVSGYLVCAYEGGGKYSQPEYVTRSHTEMNCANAQKSDK